MKRILITVCMLAILYSCSSNDDSQTPDIQEENFYALTVGNSWEYRWYLYTPEGGLSPKSVTESISIIGTEEINNNIYYKFKKTVSGNEGSNPAYPNNGEYFEHYRDSLGYLVHDSGAILFVNNTVDEFFLYETNVGFPLTAYAKLSEGNFDFTTEAGTFDCLEMRIRFENPDYEIPGVNKRYYSDGIGLIKDEDVFLADPDGSGYQRRLESYNVQ